MDSLKPSIISEINDHLEKKQKPILLKNSEIFEKTKKRENLTEKLQTFLIAKSDPLLPKMAEI